MNTVIIEDEKPAARMLQRKLEKLGIDVVQQLHSVEEAIVWFSENNHPDLIFVDIQLSDGLSFKIFETVTIQSAIIFTTAFDEFALKAFKLNSIDYLLKPIDEDDLQVAVTKFRKQKKASNLMHLDFEQIKALLANPFERNSRQRFTVKIGNGLKIIDLSSIECFFSEHKGTYIHTADNRDYLIDESMEALENELDNMKFYRISRKFIVAITAVKEIVVYSNSRLKIILPTYKNEEVIVSREKVSDFKSWLQ